MATPQPSPKAQQVHGSEATQHHSHAGNPAPRTHFTHTLTTPCKIFPRCGGQPGVRRGPACRWHVTRPGHAIPCDDLSALTVHLACTESPRCFARPPGGLGCSDLRLFPVDVVTGACFVLRRDHLLVAWPGRRVCHGAGGELGVLRSVGYRCVACRSGASPVVGIWGDVGIEAGVWEPGAPTTAHVRRWLGDDVCQFLAARATHAVACGSRSLLPPLACDPARGHMPWVLGLGRALS